MWNLKCMIISVIIGATGIITAGLKKSLEAILKNIRQIHHKGQLYVELCTSLKLEA
jgi:predicted homoserine dehydrogenase-like protein